MIFDRIENLRLYESIHPRFKRVFDHLDQVDVNALPVGRYDLDGADLYVMVQAYDTKLKDQGVWEAHRRYIDFQYVIEGGEGIGFANIHQLQQGVYDPARDFLPLHGAGDLLTVHSGHFVILMPEDAHMPGMALSLPAPVKKIVVKIARE